MCLNSRSIVAKCSDLFAYLCCHHVDILAITETFLDESILDTEICPCNYVTFRRDRSRHGGGILLMFKQDLQVSHRADFDSICSELLWMEVATLNVPLLFGVYYRSPSQSNSDIISLNYCLLSISDYPIVLCGDFNVPNIDWSVGFHTVSSLPANSLCDLVNDNYLSQLVTVPTRGDNILDLLFSNSPNFITNVQVTDNLPGTDHDAIKFTLSVVLPGKSSCKRLPYNYKRADLSLLSNVMCQVPWNTMELAGTIESSWMLFKDLFFSCRFCCPKSPMEKE